MNKIVMWLILLSVTFQTYAFTEFHETEKKENKGHNGTLFFDPNCSGGGGVKGMKHYVLTYINMPPQATNARIFIRMKTDQPGFLSALVMKRKTLAFYNVFKKAFDWKWVELKPYRANKPSGKLRIASGGKGKEFTWVDAYIITTEKNFDPEKYYQERKKKLASGGLDGKLIARLEELEKRPQAFASLTTKAPVLDGELNDKCWQNAVRMDTFTLLNGSPAKEKTEFYLCHDNKNLYVGVKAYSRILDPVENQLDSFKQNVTERDGKVFADDSIEIFLSHDTKTGEYYQFAANVNTFYDSKGFDPKWNSNATMKGKVHNLSGDKACYIIEMAIPLAEIGVTAKPDTSMYINVCRNDKSNGELCSWATLTTSFHAPDRFGKLLLGSGNFSGSIGTLKEVARGQMVLDYSLAAGTYEDLSLLVRTINGDGQVAYKTGKIDKDGKFKFDTKDEGFEYCAGIYSGDRLLYKSTDRNFGVSSQKVTIFASSEKPFKLYLNEQFLGQDKVLNVDSGLVGGINVVALKAESPVHLEIKSGESRILSDASWKINSTAVNAWNTAKIDVRSWKNAPVFTKDGKSFMGKKSGVFYLRKTIIKNTTRVYPKTHRTHPWPACKNTANELQFVLEGIKGIKTIRDYKVYLEVPEEVEFLGASGKAWWRYGVTKDGRTEFQPHPTTHRLVRVKNTGKVTNKGRKYTRYEISLINPQNYRSSLDRYSLLSCALQPKTNAPANLEAYYYMSGEGNNIHEVKNTLYINILPELKGKMPERTMNLIWYDGGSFLNNLEISKHYLETLKKAGVNWVAAQGRPETFRMLDELGIKTIAWYWFTNWSAVNGQPITDKYPYAMQVNSAGKKNPFCIPMYHIVNDPKVQAEFRKLYSAHLQKFKPNVYLWDVELQLDKDGHFVSWDKYTIADFQKTYNISGELTPAVIRDKHVEQWKEYMRNLLIEKVKILVDISKQNNIKFMFYSGWPSKRTKDHYGVDWEKIAPLVDYALCGYNMPVEAPALLKKYSGKNVSVVSGYLVNPHTPNVEDFPKPPTKAAIITRLIYTPEGYHVYIKPDARGMTAIAEVNRMLHEYEDMLIDGKRADESIKIISQTKPEDVFIYSHQGKELVIVRNTSLYTSKVHLSKTNGGYSKASEFYSGKTFKSDDIQLEIAPSDFVAILLEK